MSKMMRVILSVVACFAFVAFLGASTAQATVVGSAHDFSDDLDRNGSANTETSAFDTTEICRSCHTPHPKGQGYGSVGLLWNHAATTETSFTMYNSATMDGYTGNDPSAASILCLGCHDGSAAVDQYDSNAAGTAPFTADGTTFGGLDLIGPGGDFSETHPISITYENATDTGLHPTSDSFASGDTIASVLDNNNELQCSGCHDVHNMIVGGYPTLLRDNLTGSAICLVCHDK